MFHILYSVNTDKTRSAAAARIADRTAWQHGFLLGELGPLFWENRCPSRVGDSTVGQSKFI